VFVACLVAGTSLYLEVIGGAEPVDGPSPAVHLQASPARVASVGGEDVGIWVVEGSEAAQAAVDPAVLSVGQTPVRAAHVVVKGKDHEVATNAATVRQLLSAMGIEPDANDRVSPPPRTPLSEGMRVRFVEIAYRLIKVRHTVPYLTETQYSTEVAVGKTQTTQPGRVGTGVWTVRQTLADGRPAGRKVIEKKVARPPVTRIRTTGIVQAEAGTGAQVRDHDCRCEVGEASWYGHPGLTAASPSLPFGTHVTVKNLTNGRTVTVIINDRGPFVGGRIIDLSKQAFAEIAPLGAGVIQVRITW